MTDILFHAYLPLIFWPGLGLLLLRFLPDTFPRLLGRSLYWVGIPLEIFTLARQTDFSDQVGLAPIFTIAGLLLGLSLGAIALQILCRQQSPIEVVSPDLTLSDPLLEAEPNIDPSHLWQSRARQGSFILSSMLGNTGFVGLAIAPALVSDRYLGWIVFYSVTHNIVGTYGLGVFLSSYFGRPQQDNRWWMQFRDVLTVPSLWAFILGSLTRSCWLPPVVETGLHNAIWFIIPAALLLMGMRLSQLQGWKSLKLAFIPTILKILVIPGLIGLTTILLGLPTPASLALVLMSGMPTAFAGLILAEEYDLDRDLIASSIALTTVGLLLTIPLWIALFG